MTHEDVLELAEACSHERIKWQQKAQLLETDMQAIADVIDHKVEIDQGA